MTARSEASWSITDAFAAADTRGYLNTASVGLPPDAAVAAARDALETWQKAPDWLAWEAVGEECRAVFAELLGVRADAVALVAAAHVAAGVVANSLPPAPPTGANIVALASEHQSVLWPFLALENQGYEIRLVSPGKLQSAIDERTAVLTISCVQSLDGTVIDLEALDTHEALVYVDATQALGVTDIPLSRIDVLAVSGYKWLHCPRGLAFMVVLPRRRDQLDPFLASWKASTDPWGDPYGAPRSLTADARRYDISLPWLLAPAALASLRVLEQLTVEGVGAHCRALAAECAVRLGLEPTGSGIVAVAAVDPGRVATAGLRCSVRGGRVRFSFGAYNDLRDVNAAVDSVR